MSPETTLLATNAAFLGVAYLWLYPGLEPKTFRRLLGYDVAISGAALLVAGLLYSGDGLGFSMLVAEVPWWAFSILTFAAMELPLWEWFRRRHGIDYDL
jgi:hypothetical protein